MKKIIILVLILSVFISLTQAEEVQNNNKVFDELKDEYRLASYFLNNLQTKYYKKLSDEDKWRYLEAFWKANDLDPTTDINEFVELIKVRIEHCNTFFTHFKKGWTTDRGRIYIKHGKPYEIIKLKTTSSSKYPQKDFQIWKYRITDYYTYIFIDLQQHGDYRMIYSENDPNEGSWPDWDNYVGSDFDIGLLY